MEMEKVAVKARIYGNVQGVGYRSYIGRVAERLGLAGWIKNLADGSVEAIFQGDKDSVDKGIEFCSKGPPFSKVEGLTVEPHTFDKFLDTFRVM
jgi:acylphosphatase